MNFHTIPCILDFLLSSTSSLNTHSPHKSLWDWLLRVMPTPDHITQGLDVSLRRLAFDPWTYYPRPQTVHRPLAILPKAPDAPFNSLVTYHPSTIFTLGTWYSPNFLFQCTMSSDLTISLECMNPTHHASRPCFMPKTLTIQNVF